MNMPDDYLSDLEKRRIKRKMKRVGLAVIFWFVVFLIFTLVWYGTKLGKSYNGPIYLGLFMVTWFFGFFLTVGYFMDVEPTEVLLRRKKR